MKDEVTDLLHEAAIKALNAHTSYVRGYISQAKVDVRHSAQLIERAERILAEAVDAQEMQT